MEKDHPKKELHGKVAPKKAPVAVKEKEKPAKIQKEEVKKEKATLAEHYPVKKEKVQVEKTAKRTKTDGEVGPKKEKNNTEEMKKGHHDTAEEKIQKQENKKMKEAERQAELMIQRKIQEELKGNQDQLSPGFLEKMFAELQKKKQIPPPFQIPNNTVYKGFKTIPIQKLEPRKMHKEPPINGKNEIWKKDEVFHYRESCPLSFKHSNGFFKAIYDAYVQHADLKLTPDDVWLTIMLFFSKYVQKNEKQLRKAFVHHEGKMELKIQTLDANDDNWTEFFQKVIKAIREITVKGSTENLECNFTTTDEFSSFFSTIMIMNTYKKYISYTREGGICGIQNIHMGGQLEDWQNLEKKLLSLRQYDVNGQLKQYVDRLLPVLNQFTETYKGNAHEYFWNNLYHQREPNQKEYGAVSKVNGWLIRFFTIKEEIGREINIQQISVPVKLVNLNTKTEKMLHLVGGCRGVSIEDQNVYRPHFFYAVVKKTQVKGKK